MLSYLPGLVCRGPPMRAIPHARCPQNAESGDVHAMAPTNVLSGMAIGDGDELRVGCFVRPPHSYLYSIAASRPPHVCNCAH
jgi:hypothetical protein